LTIFCIDKGGLWAYFRVFKSQKTAMKKTILLTASIILSSFGMRAQEQIWAHTSDANDHSDDAYTVDVDNAGNRYVAGVFSDTLRVNGVDYPNDSTDGSRDAYIIKYNNNGDVQWVQTISGPSDQEIRCIKVNKTTGEVYVSGMFYYDFYIDGVKQNSLTYAAFPGTFYRTFIAKFDTNGNFSWSNNTYSTFGYWIDGANSIALSPNGSYVYFHVAFIGDVQFEGGLPVGAVGFGGQNMMLVKFNTGTGSVDTYRSDIERYLVYGKLLATDKQGNVYYAGTHSRTCMWEVDGIFGSCLVNPSSNEQGFIWKMDANFNSIWGKEISGVSYERIEAIATDNSNNVYVYGTFGDAATFDATIIDTVAGKYNGFVAKLNSAGVYQYIEQFDMDLQYTALFPHDMEVAFAVDKTGNAFFGGGFAGTLHMQTETLVSDAFVSLHYCEGYLVKLNKQGDLRWIGHYTGNTGPFDKTWIHGLAANNSFVTVAGHMVGTNMFDGDTLTGDLDSYFISSLQDCDVKAQITTTAMAVNAANPATLTAMPMPGASYQWQRNNANIPGATLNTYSAGLFGNYKCIVTYGACVLTSNRIHLSVLPPRMGENDALTAQIFPNPNSGNFSIQLGTTEINGSLTITISDLTGRAIFYTTETLQDSSISIELPAGISAGTYYVQLSGENIYQILPVIIE